MESTARQHKAEASFRRLLEEGGLPQPDAVEVEPDSLVFLWHEPELAVVVELEEPGAADSATGTAPPVAVEHGIWHARTGMKITYFASAGMSDPTRASIPLHLAANGSVEVGQETTIVLGGDAAELLLADNALTCEGVGVPPMRELLGKLRDHAVPVFVWKGCAVARGANDEDLEKVGGSWVTPPDVARLFADSDRVVTF